MPTTTEINEVTHLSIALIIICIALAAGFIVVFVWAVRNGQFKNIEGVKYRMLEDEDNVDYEQLSKKNL